MAAIDMHTHAFPDDIAGRAIEKLSAMGDWSAVGDGTVDGLLRSMDEADVDVSVLCAIATKPDQAKGILSWCKKIRSDRIDPFPSVHPATKNPARWIGRIADEGFAGIKLHPMYQDFAADEDRLDPIYAACAERGLLVALHCGRDIAFPPEDDRASPQRLRRVIDRHPRLPMLCTHLGGWEMWDEVRRRLVGTSVLMETSFSIERMDRSVATALILEHGIDKILLGSDWPWNSPAREIRNVRELDLGEAQTRDVLWANAARALGL